LKENDVKTKDKLRSRFISLTAFVPCGLDLSNFIDDFQVLRILMNCLPWIAQWQVV